MGWTKAREFVKVARKDGADFICAPWVHKAKELPKEQFKREVERDLRERDGSVGNFVFQGTLVQIKISICERKKAEHLLA
jgi:hypothetical protein